PTSTLFPYTTLFRSDVFPAAACLDQSTPRDYWFFHGTDFNGDYHFRLASSNHSSCLIASHACRWSQAEVLQVSVDSSGLPRSGWRFFSDPRILVWRVPSFQLGLLIASLRPNRSYR